MASCVRMGVKEILRHFKQLEDPRSSVNLLHPLDSVVVIAIMAVLAGANGPTAIAKWANMQSEVLLKLLDLPHGIPQKDVFRRVLATLKPDAFQACFTMWLTALRAAAAEATFGDLLLQVGHLSLALGLPRCVLTGHLDQPIVATCAADNHQRQQDDRHQVRGYAHGSSNR